MSARETNGSATTDLYREIVRRICAFEPVERIILFGSRSRGDATEQSDIDLMVLVETGTDLRAAMAEVQLRLAGLGVAKDVIVATTERFKRYQSVVNTVQWHAAKEGRILYERAA